MGRDGDDDNKYNANVSVPTEEEIEKKSDALLDDLFIYMMREKYAKDVADKEKLKNSGGMGFFKSVGGERSRRERRRKGKRRGRKIRGGRRRRRRVMTVMIVRTKVGVRETKRDARGAGK